MHSKLVKLQTLLSEANALSNCATITYVLHN